MERSVPTGWAESAMSPTPFPRAPDNLQRSLNGFFTTLEKAQNGHMMLRLLYRRRKGCTGTAQFQSMRLQACHRPPVHPAENLQNQKETKQLCFVVLVT